MTGSGSDAAFVEGVVDTYERVAALHQGPRVTRHDTTVELTRFDDVVRVTKRRDVHSMDPDTAVVVLTSTSIRPNSSCAVRASAST